MDSCNDQWCRFCSELNSRCVKGAILLMWPVHFVRALPRLIPPPVHANLLVDPLGKHVKCQLSIVFIQAEPIVKAGYCVPGIEVGHLCQLKRVEVIITLLIEGHVTINDRSRYLLHSRVSVCICKQLNMD